MKKIFNLMLVCIFVFSLIPNAFSGVIGDGTDTTQTAYSGNGTNHASGTRIENSSGMDGNTYFERTSKKNITIRGDEGTTSDIIDFGDLFLVKL